MELYISLCNSTREKIGLIKLYMDNLHLSKYKSKSNKVVLLLSTIQIKKNKIQKAYSTSYGKSFANIFQQLFPKHISLIQSFRFVSYCGLSNRYFIIVSMYLKQNPFDAFF